MKLTIITISDTRTVETDISGKIIEQHSITRGWQIIGKSIVKDEIDFIKNTIEQAVITGTDVVITSGGTGVAPRDVTPEATRLIIDIEIPGIAEYIRAESMKKNINAILSRGIAGIKNKTVIVNLPGSAKAAAEIMPILFEPLEHCHKLINNIKVH